MLNKYLFIFLCIISGMVFANNNDIEGYLKDLEELGYCVIPEVFSKEETEVLYNRVWKEFIEKAFPDCKLEDRSNWQTSFPQHNPMGLFAGPAGQTQVLWDIRQDPRIIQVFANIWNTSDLIVSMDGLSLMCPVEIREGLIEPWPHVDQAVMKRYDSATHDNQCPQDFISESLLKTAPYTIQGQFLFEDSFDGDGGFYCIPRSHLRFDEFAPELERINTLTNSRKDIRKQFLEDFFKEPDDQGHIYCKKQITAPKGSLILWDSRTIHWNQHADKNRISSNNPKARMVSYLCYVPKTRLTEKGRSLRKKAFDEGVSTGHNPSNPELKFTKDHIHKDYIRHMEDSSYTQPSIHLTEHGIAILGVD